MQKFLYSLIACICFLPILVLAQCPENELLNKRIAFLRTSSIPAKEMLKEVHGYLSRINTCPYKNDSTHTSLLGLTAFLYFEEGDYVKSIQYRRQAIDIITANAHKPSARLNALPIQYYGLSLAYDSLDNFSEKMKALDSCSTISIRLNYVDQATLRAIYTFIMYFFDIGDYQRCIDYAVKCQLLGKQYKINNTLQEQLVGDYYISSSFMWQVIALMKLKNFSEAEMLLVDKVTDFKKAGLTNYLGTTYSQLAEVQLNKGDYGKALSFYNQALKWDGRAGYSFNCKQTLKDIGHAIYYDHYNDRNKALAYYRWALSMVNQDKQLATADAFESLDLFAKIANVYVKEKRYDSAFHYFQLAFNQIKYGSNEKTVVQSSSNEIIQYKKIHYLTSLLLDKGNACVSQYKDGIGSNSIQQAIAVFKATDQLLDRIRTEQKDPQSKLFWRSDSRRLYENAIEACYISGNKKDAFYFFEKSRAVLLSDQLNEQRWQGLKDIQQQNRLKKTILQLERQIVDINISSQQLNQLQEELFNAKQNLDRIQQNIKTNTPLYYQSFVKAETITPLDVQEKILKDHQALIELFEGDYAVYVLCITAQATQFNKINKAAFDSLSHSYIAHLSNPALLNKNFTEFTKTARALCQLIFQNINLPEGRIIISPGGTNFPYEALVTNNPNQPLSYFVESHAVSYTFSARYLVNQFSENSGNSSSVFLGISPVQYAPSLRLPELYGSDRSLLQLQKKFSHTAYFTAAQASKNNFLQQFYRYKIVQLYTHSTDSGQNGEPTIFFQDSALLLSDLIYENKPATRLIVLSACETGKGKLYLGEGVFSFNRGFASIGIPSSVTNLWQVDNESTYRLTELFYKWLSKELPIDVALQKAKTEFMSTATKEKRLPYYWAAPVLAGQSEAIKVKNKFSWAWLAGGFCFALLLFWKGYAWAKNNHLQKRKKPALHQAQSITM